MRSGVSPSRRRLMLLALALGSPVAAKAQAAPKQLAVFPVIFYGRGANSLEKGVPAIATTTDSILRAELAQSRRFELVPPARLAQVVATAESGGTECVSQECRRGLSRTLGAAWMVTAKLSKTSNLIWYLSGQLTDVASGRRLLDDEFELKGIAEDIAKGGAHSLARRIVNAVESARPVLTSGRRMDPATLRTTLAGGTDNNPPDLTRADLSGMDLSGIDFKRANLT